MSRKQNRNPHRVRGTGRGTDSVWQIPVSLEGGPGLPAASALQNAGPESHTEAEAKTENPKDASGFHKGLLVEREEETALPASDVEQYSRDVLDKTGEPIGEKRKPKDFFEKVLVSTIEETYNHIQKGLALIREINSKQKKWQKKEGVDNRQISYNILNNIPKVNADDETFLAEIERLGNFQEYNVDELRQKIDSDSRIIEIRNSGKPESERQKEYGQQVGKLLREEVRRIFKEDKVAGVGKAVKIAFYLESCVHKGLVEIVDNIEDEKKLSAQTENISGTQEEKREKIAEENQREDFVRQILGNNQRLEEIILYSIGKNSIPTARLLEVMNKIRSEKVEQELLESVRSADPEQAENFIELDMSVDEKLGGIILRDFRDILTGEEKNIDKIVEAEATRKREAVSGGKFEILERKIAENFPQGKMDFIVRFEMFSREMLGKINKECEGLLGKNISDEERSDFALTLLKSRIAKKYAEKAETIGLPKELAADLAEYIIERIKIL